MPLSSRLGQLPARRRVRSSAEPSAGDSHPVKAPAPRATRPLRSVARRGRLTRIIAAAAGTERGDRRWSRPPSPSATRGFPSGIDGGTIAAFLPQGLPCARPRRYNNLRLRAMYGPLTGSSRRARGIARIDGKRCSSRALVGDASPSGIAGGRLTSRPRDQHPARQSFTRVPLAHISASAAAAACSTWAQHRSLPSSACSRTRSGTIGAFAPGSWRRTGMGLPAAGAAVGARRAQKGWGTGRLPREEVQLHHRHAQLPGAAAAYFVAAAVVA